MNDKESLTEKSRVLKESIVDAINIFKAETGIWPFINISVTERHEGRCEVSHTINVIVSVNL